jgi:hypothetical protein
MALAILILSRERITTSSKKIVENKQEQSFIQCLAILVLPTATNGEREARSWELESRLERQPVLPVLLTGQPPAPKPAVPKP